MYNIDFYIKFVLNCFLERVVYLKVVNKMIYLIYYYKSSLIFYFFKENDLNNF